MRGWWAAISCGLLACAAPAEPGRPQPYRSLTGDFAAFADATAELPMAARIAAFHARFAPLFPAFYRPRDGRSAADFDDRIARALGAFPQDRDAISAVEQAFAEKYAGELARFGRAFPGFRLTSPVYLLHSLGEFDAGTRVFGRQRILIFAADGIAAYDPPDALPMLLDHEFFHIAHGRAFPGCLAVWCSLWREGLAVYAASILNPGASDAQLGLEGAEPLRQAVDADRRTGLCLLQARLGAADRRSIRSVFLSGGGVGAMPPRFGYYLGYLVARRAGQTQSLAMLTRLAPKPAHQLVIRTLAAMIRESGGCADVAQP